MSAWSCYSDFDDASANGMGRPTIKVFLRVACAHGFIWPPKRNKCKAASVGDSAPLFTIVSLPASLLSVEGHSPELWPVSDIISLTLSLFAGHCGQVSLDSSLKAKLFFGNSGYLLKHLSIFYPWGPSSGTDLQD